MGLPRERLDVLLVARGLAEDLKQARALVLAGQVLSGDTLLSGAAELLPREAPLRLRGIKAFASRGGGKLDAALEASGILVQGLRCLDLGASTGGFTDCLLRRGAAGVLCVDVGFNQLAWELRRDPRVECREGTDYRALTEQELPRPLGFACADLSFTSVRPVLPLLGRWLEPHGAWTVLVKPQFEAAAAEVGARGVVRDDGVRARTLEEARAAAEAAGLGPFGSMESPVEGANGNREWLLWGRKA